MSGVVLNHQHLPLLIVDGYLAATFRLGQALARVPYEQIPANPTAALAVCVATRTPCEHGLTQILAVIGEGGVAARCAACWPGTNPPDHCPTCRRRIDPLWLAGLFTGCRSCGELMIPDYTGQVRVVPDDLLSLLLPEDRAALAQVREAMVSAGASA